LEDKYIFVGNMTKRKWHALSEKVAFAKISPASYSLAATSCAENLPESTVRG